MEIVFGMMFLILIFAFSYTICNCTFKMLNIMYGLIVGLIFAKTYYLFFEKKTISLDDRSIFSIGNFSDQKIYGSGFLLERKWIEKQNNL
jgi:hypothetical protein